MTIGPLVDPHPLRYPYTNPHPTTMLLTNKDMVRGVGGTMAMVITISQVNTIITIINSNRFKVGHTTMIGTQGRLVVIDDKKKEIIYSVLQKYSASKLNRIFETINFCQTGAHLNPF